MTGQEELERGQQAADVLANPMYQEAMERLITEATARWQKEKDADARDWLWMLVQAGQRVNKVLEETMQTGKLRSKQIEMEQGRLARIGKTLKRF